MKKQQQTNIIPNITFESALKGIKDIKARNKAFEKLSSEGQRLEIAWDCLQLITGGKVRASDGHY